MIEVVNDALQSAVKQRLTHHVQFLAQRVEYHHVVFGVEVGVVVVVLRFGEGVVHYLAETVVGQIVAHHVLYLVGVGLATVRQTAAQTFVERNFVVAVDTHNLLNHITFARYIHFVGGYQQCHAFGVVALNLYAEHRKYRFYGIHRDFLAHQSEDAFVVYLHLATLYGFGVNVCDFGTYGAAGQLFYKQCRTLDGVNGDIGVAATLETERGVCLKSVIFRGFTYAYGIEVGTFEEHVGCLGFHARFLAAEHAGNAHTLFLVAYHQLVAVEFALNAVQSGEHSACGKFLHYHLTAFDFVGIEGVEWLSHLHQHEVGDIHHVVDRTYAHGQ